jgi:O-6-methylguanine DNA methyltransferase
MRLQLERWTSPLTELLLVTDEEGNLRALEFSDHEQRMDRLLRAHYGNYEIRNASAPTSITKALRAYFNGELDALDKVPVATGGTEFQRKVWQALRKIPAGKTKTYGQQAASIGRPSASRAVGAANGLNPIAIVVPCHRVIGASGKLTGYAGGLKAKQWLLDHERRYSSNADQKPDESKSGEIWAGEVLEKCEPAGHSAGR